MTIAADKGPTKGLSDGDTTIAVTLVATTSGASVAVCVIWAPNTTNLSTVDVGGQSATIRSTSLASSAAIGRVEFATLDTLSSGGDKVITATLSANVATGSGIIIAWSFTGTNTSGVFDVANNAAAAGTPSLTMTTVADNCHIIGVLSIDTSTTPTAGTNYTGVDITDSDWWNYSEKDTDFDAGTAGAKTVNFTGVSSNYTLSALALKPSAGGGGGTTAALLLLPGNLMANIDGTHGNFA